MFQRLLLLAALVSLSGCASLTAIQPEQAFQHAPRSVELRDVPFYPQEKLLCGPAALATVLTWSGVPTKPDQLTGDLFIPDRKGTLQPEVVAQARRRGRLVYQIPPTLDAVMAELHAGHPVLVLQNNGLSWWTEWHYAVVVGYDAAARNFILRSGTDRRHLLSLDLFHRTWERARDWGIVVLRPDDLPATANPQAFLKAASDLEQVNQKQAALKAYRAAMDRWPRNGGFYIAAANVEYARGNLEAARETLEQGTARDASERGALYNNLAQILADEKQWDAATTAAEKAVAAGGSFEKQARETLEGIKQKRREAR